MRNYLKKIITAEKISKKIASVDEDQRVIEVFFHEVTETIDYVYNLIISKQLGG